jgi:hypothetical protein
VNGVVEPGMLSMWLSLLPYIQIPKSESEIEPAFTVETMSLAALTKYVHVQYYSTMQGPS